MDIITDFVSDVEQLLMTIAGSMAVIGVLGLSFMYLGASLPFMAQWKQDHPRAFNDIALGLLFLAVASSGGLAALVGN